jgi:tRNA (guanine10-N2)-methyltransferase
MVLDPFVGSGSILVSAAKFGGYVMGTDIDYRLLYGLSKPTRIGVKEREPNETVFSNLEQYNLEDRYVDILVGDASRPVYRKGFLFDSVITDPPYGIRETSQKIGTLKEDVVVPEHLLDQHVPSKVHYNLNCIMNDLLKFSAEYLKIGGRLVFWMPINKDEDNQLLETTVEPKHKCFRLICTPEQVLTRYTSRVLICMEKYRELDDCESGGDAEDQVIEIAKNFRDNFFNSVRERIAKSTRTKKTKNGFKPS